MELSEEINIWIVLAFLLVVLVWYWWKRPGPNYPPGPRGVPFLGTLPFFGTHVFRTFQKWSAVYGPVFSVRFGGKPTVTINDYESLTQAFLKQEKDFSDRPWIDPISSVWGENGLVTKSFNDDFKIQKSFLVKGLHGFGSGNRGEAIIMEEIEYYHDELRKLAGKPFNIELRLMSAITNILATTLFGERFDYKDPDFLALVDTILQIANPPSAAIKNIVAIIPSLKVIPPFKSAAAHYRDLEFKRADIIQKYIDLQKKSLEENNLRGIIDAFHKEMKIGTESFTDKQLLALVREIFMAGTLSVQMQMLWLIAILPAYPEYYERIKEEVDAIEGEKIELEHLLRMPFTRAFILEVMRMSSIASIGIVRITAEDTQLCGYSIPKGTEVMSNWWAANNDPKTWENPEMFDPNRFIDTDGKYVPSPKVVNFSMGVRKCPGEKITRDMVFLMIGNLVRDFEVSIVADPLPTFENGEVPGFSSPCKYEVLLEKR